MGEWIFFDRQGPPRACTGYPLAMKGVILAGGLGTRLHPLTKATNKHLLPVGREPMLYHPIRQMISAGIRDILLITSTDHMGDIVRCLGSGMEFGCSLTYKVQERPAEIADALALAEGFAAGSPICVLLATTCSSTASPRMPPTFGLSRRCRGAAQEG